MYKYLHNLVKVLSGDLNSFLIGVAHFSISFKNSSLHGYRGLALKSRSTARRFTGGSQKNLCPRRTANTAFRTLLATRGFSVSLLHVRVNCSSRQFFSAVYVALNVTYAS